MKDISVKSAARIVLKETFDALARGGVVVSPTDTVYGLLADATNKKAIQKVFLIKGRQKNKALPVFVKDIRMAKKLAYISKEQETFLRKVWPGKVTVIVKSRGVLPKALEQSGKVALRIPDYDLVRKIVRKLEKPLTATSANVSKQPSCSDSSEVIAQFQKRKQKPDLLLDAGLLKTSKPSVVIDISEGDYNILRN